MKGYLVMEISDKELEVGKKIATKIRIPKKVREKIYTKVFIEFGMAILVFVYFIFINLGYIKLDRQVFKEDLHSFAGFFIVFTVIIFEIAYKKDSGLIAMRGVEVLVLSILTLFMPYVYFYRSAALKFLYSFSAMYIGIYYSIKALIVYELEIRKYKYGLSDVKEIVFDSEESYLDEENEKRFDENELECESVSRKMKTKKRIMAIVNEDRKRKRAVNTPKKTVKKEVEKKVQEKPVEVEKKKVVKKVSKKIEKEPVKVEKKMTKKADVKVEKEEKVTKPKTTAKRGRGRPRKKTKIEVKSLATAGRRKKENGD